MTEIIAHYVWKNVDRRGDDECWPWLAGYNKRGGHGVAYIGNQKSMSAPRAVYQLMVRPLDRDEELDHLCRNPICVNPAHLEPVTHLVNVRRGRAGATTRARCASITHCPQGHEYSPGNTRLGKLQNGYVARSCRTCSMARASVSNARVAAERLAARTAKAAA